MGDADTGDPACLSSNGQCTLRAAVDQANALTSDDEIVLGAGPSTWPARPARTPTPAGTWTSTSRARSPSAERGRAPTVRSNGADRVFHVLSDSVSTAVGTIQSLAVTGGGVTQGGGNTGQTTTLAGLAIYDNQADSQGGTFGARAEACSRTGPSRSPTRR